MILGYGRYYLRPTLIRSLVAERPVRREQRSFLLLSAENAMPGSLDKYALHVRMASSFEKSEVLMDSHNRHPAYGQRFSGGKLNM